MINRCLRFILLLFFPLVLAVSSCVGHADDSASNNNYTVDLSTVRKAVLKYFDIQKSMLKDWEGCAISLDNPNRCVNLRGEVTGYIFDVALGDAQKGWMAINATKKWRPLICSGSGSFRKMVEDFRNYRKIGEDANIEYICIDGVMIVFRVITQDRIERYYASGLGLSAHPYSELRKSALLKIQKRNDSMTDKDDFVRESVAIWDDLDKTILPQVQSGRAAVPAAPNQAKIRAEVLGVARTVYANNEVSMLSLKIIDYKSIEGAWPNPGEIEAVAYHKNNDVSLLLEIENGDEIEAVLSLDGDERGTVWQIKEVKTIKSEQE